MKLAGDAWLHTGEDVSSREGVCPAGQNAAVDDVWVGGQESIGENRAVRMVDQDNLLGASLS